MNPPNRSAPLGFPFLFVLLLLVALSVTLGFSCKSTQALESPKRAWVDASRKIHDVLAPRLQTYLAADDQLDPITRDTLLRTIGDWEFLIRQGEATIPAVGLPVGGGQ